MIAFSQSTIGRVSSVETQPSLSLSLSCFALSRSLLRHGNQTPPTLNSPTQNYFHFDKQRRNKLKIFNIYKLAFIIGYILSLFEGRVTPKVIAYFIKTFSKKNLYITSKIDHCFIMVKIWYFKINIHILFCLNYIYIKN